MSRPAKARSLNVVSESSEPQAQIPTTEEIATRAYEIYQSRGCQHGADVEDWLQAERELSQIENKRTAHFER